MPSTKKRNHQPEEHHVPTFFGGGEQWSMAKEIAPLQ